MEKQVLEILKIIKSEKIHQRKAPAHVMKKELFDAINKALDNLQSAGMIKVGDTINSTWIDPIE